MLTDELPLVVQLAVALSPEVLKAGLADAVRPRPPGVGDVQTRYISSVSTWPFRATFSLRPKNPQIQHPLGRLLREPQAQQR